MDTVDHELDRVLMLLRNKIREQGFTQLQVQEQLEWGRSYISQLLTKQKSLRVEQVLRILHVIDVDPAEFYAELYRFPRADAVSAKGDRYPMAVDYGGYRGVAEVAGDSSEQLDALRFDVRSARSTLQNVLGLMREKSILTEDELKSLITELMPSKAEPATH